MDMQKLFPGEESFIKVAKNYYNKNFGTMSKSEIDLLMFQILYLKLKIQNDNRAPSDFELAKILGITSQRVQNLREKMELKYPTEDIQSWKIKTRKLFKTPAFQQVNDKEEIHVFINDVMLRYDIEDFLESNYFPAEYTLNRKVIILRKPAVYALVYACCTEEDRMNVMNEMSKEFGFDKEEIEKNIAKNTWWNRWGKTVASELWDICKNILIIVNA